MADTRFEDCPELLRNYLFYAMTIKGRSVRTVDGYAGDIKYYLRYLTLFKSGVRGIDHERIQNTDITGLDSEFLRKITLGDTYEFLNFVMTAKGNNAKTRARKVSSIRAFFNYLTVNANILDENPVRNLDTPSLKKTLPKYLTLEESIELLAGTAKTDSPRDYCIITLLLNCGMRLSELVGMNENSIRGNQLRLLGKGNKERIIYLNEACLAAIEGYRTYKRSLDKGRIVDKEAMFLSKNGKRLSGRRVEQIVEQCLKLAQLDGKGYSPHKLRHTAATLMYQHGNVDIRVLKEILGHENMATTEIYTHVANAQIEEAASRSPLAKVKR